MAKLNLDVGCKLHNILEIIDITCLFRVKNKFDNPILLTKVRYDERLPDLAGHPRHFVEGLKVKVRKHSAQDSHGYRLRCLENLRLNFFKLDLLTLVESRGVAIIARGELLGQAVDQQLVIFFFKIR